MRLKILLASLFAAGLAVSAALASPPPGSPTSADTATTSTAESGHHGKPPKTGDECRPKVAIILKGEYVSGSADASGVGSFVMLVQKANRHGRDLELVGKQATIMVDARTKIRRHGHATLADFKEHDRLNVQVRACKGQAPAQLLARRISGHAPAPADDEQEQGETTTTTTTTTTG